MTESENSEEPKPWVDYPRRREILEQQLKENQDAEKLEKKNELKLRVENLIADIETNYYTEKQEIEELKQQLLSAIEEVYESKRIALLDVEESKTTFLNLIQVFIDRLNSEFSKKMTVLHELIIVVRETHEELKIELTRAKSMQETLESQVKAVQNAYDNYLKMAEELNARIFEHNQRVAEFNRLHRV